MRRLGWQYKSREANLPAKAALPRVCTSRAHESSRAFERWAGAVIDSLVVMRVTLR